MNHCPSYLSEKEKGASHVIFTFARVQPKEPQHLLSILIGRQQGLDVFSLKQKSGS
jgi:hypothetical protein